MNPSLIVAAMKRAILLTALVVIAVPMFAQSTEFGVLVGGGRRFIDTGDAEEGRELEDNKFTLSNNAVDLYWSMILDDTTRLKFKVGRLKTPVAFEIEAPTADDPDNVLRRDVDGEMQHGSAVIEYRFSEPYGSTSLFAGLGFYRQSGDDDEVDDHTGYGFQVGVNADFPISRKYGVITEATYHWSRGPFTPRYLTLTGGLRFAF